jgi:MFS family permease
MKTTSNGGGYLPIMQAFADTASSDEDSSSDDDENNNNKDIFTQVNEQIQHHKKQILTENSRVPLIICIIIACSAFPFSLLHYFLPQMLTKQFQISHEDVGKYAGLVDFSDSIGSFLSSAFIGYLSDVYGKKWLLTISLASSMIRLLLYAFIGDIWILIGIEFVYGLVNSTSVLVRALLVEFSNNDNRVTYFGYMTASYAISRSLRYVFLFVTIFNTQFLVL